MRNVWSIVGSVPSNGSGSRTLAWEPSPCVLTFLANAKMVVARLFPAFSSSESVVFPKVHHLSPHLLVLRGCCPYSESIRFGEISEFRRSLLLDDVLVMGLNVVKDVD